MLSFLLGLLSKCYCLILRTSDTHSFPPPLSKEEERELFRKSAVKRAKFEGLQRNIQALRDAQKLK